MKVICKPVNAPAYDADDAKEERKKGKWINIKTGIPVDADKEECWCSVCKTWLVASDEYDVKHNFCPYCGADMRGEI